MEIDTRSSLRRQRIRDAMSAHVEGRLRTALSKIKGAEDSTAKQRRQSAVEKYQLRPLVEKGAAAAEKIEVASHIAKGVHPDLKVRSTTNLAVDFEALPKLQFVGSHVLAGRQAALDATGDGAFNSAAYELYLLLQTTVDGVSLGQLLDQGDEDLISELNALAPRAAERCASLATSKCASPSVSTLNKQVYWLVGPESCATGCDGYDLLVPLYPTSLVHVIYGDVHEHRWGEANKAARQARKEGRAHDGVFHDYPGLAVQKLGGTKPQNISQLNSERGGVNYLLSSLPPRWTPSPARLPVHAASVFDRLFIARPVVREALHALRRFLASDPEPNRATRDRREELVDTLIDELVAMAGELQQVLPPGWTRDRTRYERLDPDEQLWLDPLRAELPDEQAFAERWLLQDWPAAIGRRFGNWLNFHLGHSLPVGDVEGRAWAKELLTDEDGFKQQLRAARERLGAPHHIPIRPHHGQAARSGGLDAEGATP